MNFYRHTIIMTPNIYIPMVFVYDFLHHKGHHLDMFANVNPETTKTN